MPYILTRASRNPDGADREIEVLASKSFFSRMSNSLASLRLAAILRYLSFPGQFPHDVVESFSMSFSLLLVALRCLN